MDNKREQIDVIHDIIQNGLIHPKDDKIHFCSMLLRTKNLLVAFFDLVIFTVKSPIDFYRTISLLSRPSGGYTFGQCKIYPLKHTIGIISR